MRYPYPKHYSAQVSIEFLDKVHADIENEFISQQTLINEVADIQFSELFYDFEPTIIQDEQTQQIRKRMIQFQDKKNEKKIYFVQLPVYQNDAEYDRRNELPAFNLKWWFYFKSNKSQDFWMRKNAYVLLE